MDKRTRNDATLPRGGVELGTGNIKCTNTGPIRDKPDAGLDKFGMGDSRYTDPASALSPTPPEQMLQKNDDSDF